MDKKKKLFRELTRESVREYERAKEGGRCCSRLMVEIRYVADIQLPRDVHLASFPHLSSVSTWGARQKGEKEEGSGEKRRFERGELCNTCLAGKILQLRH